MNEQELKNKTLELDAAERNLHTMRELAYAEHISNTQTIKKVSAQIISELTAQGHLCVRGEQIARMEGKIDTILERQAEIKTELTELFHGRNSNAKRIDRIEVLGGAVVLVIGASWTVFIWLAEKLTWK